MKAVNPYRPGAGQMPIYLAGRETELEEINSIFDTLIAGVATRSVIYSGLRGVGKTVLLNILEENAEDKKIFCRHIEVEENRDFVLQIVTCMQIYLRENSSLDKVKEVIEKLLDDIKALVVTYNPNTTSFSLSIQEKQLYQGADYGQMFTELFESIGKVAKKISKPICFFVDEIQYMKQKDLELLIAAIHRSNQLGYPIMIVGAGLPKIYKMLSEVKSYSERLFDYREIDSLSYDEARDAIVKPGEKFGFFYNNKAVDKIIEITKGYPFFIQQFCGIVYNEISHKVTDYDVEIMQEKYYEILDLGFYKVRYSRCSEMEKRFIRAMVNCNELPCTISNVAHNMNKSVTSVSTFRAQLINKGIIYSTKRSELDFTAPGFGDFIIRTEHEI